MQTGFVSHGDRCGATWLAADSDVLTRDAGRPCVVMAHGYGCTQDCGLMPFAERFASVGCDVLLFDYRGFGTSGGTRRQLVSHLRQREDYHAAIASARSRPGIDPDRVALWGTSYSGGHVVAVAAQDHRVAALIAQGAAVDGLAILTKAERADPQAPAGKGRRMIGKALLDVAHTLTGRPSVLVDSVGPPGEFAMLTDPDTYEDFLAMMGPTWRKEVCARSLLSLPFNRPVQLADQVECPALFVIAERDSIAPAAAVREAARRVGPQAEVVSYDCPHFAIYLAKKTVGETIFERSVTAQAEFLARVLRAAR